MGKAIWAGVGLVAVAVAGVVGGAAWGGREAERQYRDWLATLEDPQAGLHASSLAYERGLFSATARTRIEWRAPFAAADAPPLALIAEHRVQHGPIAPADWLAEGRWTPRLGAMRTTLHVDPASAAALPGLRSAPEAARIDSQIGFDGGSTHDVTIAALDYADAASGDALQLKPLTGRYVLDRQRHLRGELHGDGLTLRFSVAAPPPEAPAVPELPDAATGAAPSADEGSQTPPPSPQGPLPREPRIVDAGGLKFDFDQTVQAGGYWPGQATIAAQRIAVGDGSGEPLAAFEQPQVRVTLASADGQLYDLREAFSVERVLAHGQNVGPLRFTLVGERLARAALDDLRGFYRTLAQAGGPASIEEPAMQAQLAAIGRKAIAARPRFGFTDIDLRLPGQQPVTGRLLIGLRPPAEDNLPPQAFLREALDTIDLLIDAPALAWGEAGNAGADSGRIEGLRFTATATPGLASVDADFRLDRLVTHVIGLAGPTDVTLSGLRGDSRQKRGQTTLLIGDANVGLDELHVTGGAGEEPSNLKLSRFTIQVLATEDGEYLGFRERFALEALELDGKPQGRGELSLVASRLHGPTLLKLQRAGDEFSTLSPGSTPDPTALIAAMMEFLPHHPVLAFENVHIEKTGEPLPLDARLALTLQPPTDPSAPDAALQYLQAAQGQVAVPESFVLALVTEQVHTAMANEAEMAEMERRMQQEEAGAQADPDRPEAGTEPDTPLPEPDPQQVAERARQVYDENLAQLLAQGWLKRADGRLSTVIDYRERKLTLNGVELPVAQMLGGE